MNGSKLAVGLFLIVLFRGLLVHAGVVYPLVGLNSIRAEVRNRQVVVCWQTISDSGIVYYDLLRYQPDEQKWAKVNNEVLVSSNSITGASYELIDSAARPFKVYSYRLVQTDQFGNQRVTDPFVIKSAKTAVALSSKVSSITAVAVPAAGSSAVNDKPLAISSLQNLDGRTFVKITTTNYGLQFVAAADLATLLGQPLADVKSAISQGLFHLTVSGQPVTYLPLPDGGSLLFYAEAHKDNYSTNNIYWLTAQTNSAVGVQNGQAPVPTAAAIWYPAAQFYWKDAIYKSDLPLGPEDDPWMWFKLVAGLIGFNTANYYLAIDHLTQGTDRPAQISINLWGGVATTHAIQVTVNTNNVLGQWGWNGLTPTNLIVSVPSTILVAGNNQLKLVAMNGGGSLQSSWYVNSFTLSYPRTYTATNGLIDFTANSNSIITIDGFTGTNVTLLDVTNPKQPTLVTNLTIDQPATTYRVSFVPSSPVAHCVAYQTGAAAPVSSLALAQIAGLSASSNAADYLIVSPPMLLPAATNLAVYRQQTGLKTIIAPLDLVYNEFGYGFPTPHAIQALLATAWTNWSMPPHYLVLLGKGTYDFRDILQYHNNLTPPLMVSTPSGVVASDSLMGDVNGDGLPEVAVGRLSGSTTNDLFTLINKIKAYESNSPPVLPKALLIADAYDAGAGNFPSDALLVDAVMINKFTDIVLLSTNAGVAEPMHSQIITQWYQGVDFANYVGHGAASQFGTAGYLASADLTNSLLLNCARLPVVTAMTCVAGQYSLPNPNCLGEYLVQPAAGGAIAFFGPSGLGNNGEDSELNVRMATLLRANAQLCLGDMVLQAMSDHISQDLPSIPAWIFNLLGDPALHYNLTRNLLPLQITSINPAGITWTGSLPPYQVEWATNLPAVWQSSGSALMGNHAAITHRGSMGFFRVRGSQ